MLHLPALAISNLLDQLFPAPCLVCGLADPDYQLLCPECDRALPRLSQENFLCRCCALPLTSDAPLCGKCLNKPPAFAQSSIAFRYVHPLDYLIHQFKYRRQLSSGKLLAQLLADTCQQSPRPDFLVPVPIHWRKRWQRGFNQSELMAYWIGKHLDIPVLSACQQKHHHHSQKGLGRAQRLKNLRQTFSVKPGNERKIANAHIALIDDVVTTTATVRTLSELLVKAGAQRVDIWALARTPDH
ncbi:MAG: amidophosphoribosyltransferase [Cellvibrio sp.]|jgi:ComF family protein|nr:amidophosphoribosyltransferase [Cellvibrio sp.]